MAAAILAFALTGLLFLFMNAAFLNEANRNLCTAVGHGQFALEELKNTNFSSINSQAWDQTVIASKGLTPLNSETIVIAVTGIKIKDIQATVNWKDRGVRNRNITLETLITEQ